MGTSGRCCHHDEGQQPDAVAGTEVVRAYDATLDSFAESVDPQLTGVARNEAQSRTLAALRDALLPKLISGEIRVPAAEAATEEAV